MLFTVLLEMTNFNDEVEQEDEIFAAMNTHLKRVEKPLSMMMLCASKTIRSALIITVITYQRSVYEHNKCIPSNYIFRGINPLSDAVKEKRAQ